MNFGFRVSGYWEEYMDIRLTLIRVACLFLLLPGWAGISRAEEPLTVAVAANFAPALEKISKKFTLATGIPVRVSVSSSGRLYAQIRNGAPFDLFFSADQKRPTRLFKEGRCEQPVVYVNGSVVLWSRTSEVCSQAGTWQNAVKGTGPGKIGLANPELAPYGMVTRTALLKEKLWKRVQDRLVFGNNVAQAFQYAATGATNFSFIALSLALTSRGEKGCFLPVPEAGPVAQSVCLVRSSTNRPAAEQLLTFMSSPEATTVLEQYGYTSTPENPGPM